MLRLSAIISLLLIIISLGLIYTNLVEDDQSLILRPDNSRNVKIIGSRNDVLQIAIAGFLFVLINIFLARSFQKKLPILMKIISFANLFLALLILVIISGIIVSN
jgi:hypothetical protein